MITTEVDFLEDTRQDIQMTETGILEFQDQVSEDFLMIDTQWMIETMTGDDILHDIH